MTEVELVVATEATLGEKTARDVIILRGAMSRDVAEALRFISTQNTHTHTYMARRRDIPDRRACRAR